MRLRLKIDDHDVAVKMRNIERFLTEGDKVKVSVMFRGRELSHWQLGRDLLDRVASQLKEVGTIERPPAMEGRNMSIIMTPTPLALKRAEAAKPAHIQPPAQSTMAAEVQG